MNKQEIREQEAPMEQEEIMEKHYTLRRLVDRDLFPILGIIGEVFPDDLAKVFVQLTTKEKTVQEVGATAVLKIVLAVLKNMDKVKGEVYALLSDVSGIPAAEIQEMEFGTTPNMIWDIISNEKNNSFFKVLSKLS
jgi:hypothetical protein